MRNNSDWEYWFYLDDWVRRQNDERRRQNAFEQRAATYIPATKHQNAKPAAVPERPTDIVFGFLLLAFSGWLATKVYLQTEGILSALGAFLITGFVLDGLYRLTPLGFVIRWFIRSSVVVLIAFGLIGSLV